MFLSLTNSAQMLVRTISFPSPNSEDSLPMSKLQLSGLSPSHQASPRASALHCYAQELQFTLLWKDTSEQTRNAPSLVLVDSDIWRLCSPPNWYKKCSSLRFREWKQQQFPQVKIKDKKPWITELLISSTRVIRRRSRKTRADLI